MASSNSPCAACKFLRRKCTQECVFAPYFPPDLPQKFANVHKVFGASNVAKLLNDLPSSQREDAVNSLAYEAEARLRDPIYGCVGLISILQHKLKQVQGELFAAKKELATYIGPSAMHPMVLPTHNPQMLHHHQNPSSSMLPFGAMPPMGLGLNAGPSVQPHLFRDQQQQILEVQAAHQQQMAALAREQELMRSYEQQTQELRYSSGGFDGNSGSVAGPNATTFNHMSSGLSSNLGLVTMDNQFPLHPQQQQQQSEQQLIHHQLQQSPQPTQQQRADSEEGTSGVIGPSS